MKQRIVKLTIALVGLFLSGSGMISAQSSSAIKSDKIIFLDGNAKEGKVIAFANDKIRFTHRGETLNYEFNKKEIEKIEYASGRTEVLTERTLPETVNARNKVAVLPLGYIGDGNDSKMENMPFLLQEMTIEFLSKSASELKFMDAVEMNARLLKAGINESNMRLYTSKELAGLLHVEYIIMGNVMQDRGKIVTVNHNHTEGRKRIDRNWDGYKVKERRESHGSSVTGQQIENQVSLSIYNNEGEKIYSKTRHSLISTVDGYKNTLRYLLKRIPLYER